MIFFDLAGVDLAVSLAADTDDVPERPIAQFVDKLVLLLDLVLNCLHPSLIIILKSPHRSVARPLHHDLAEVPGFLLLHLRQPQFHQSQHLLKHLGPRSARLLLN